MSLTRAERASLRSSILILAGSPTGVTCRDVSVSEKVAQHYFRKMEAAGELVCIKGGAGRFNRYFTSPRTLENFRRQTADADQARLAKAPTKGHKLQRAWWPKDAPAHIPKGLKIQRAPTPPAPTRTNTFSRFG